MVEKFPDELSDHSDEVLTKNMNHYTGYIRLQFFVNVITDVFQS